MKKFKSQLLIAFLIGIFLIGQVFSVFAFTGQSSSPLTLYYYAIVNSNGDNVLRGQTYSDGVALPNGVLLAPNTLYRLWVLKADNLWLGFLDFTTGASGINIDLPPILVAPATSPDADQDGLSDEGEYIVGTNLNDSDTDDDGILDAAEVKQGLNPLDNFSATTGIVSVADTPGTAVDICAVNGLVAVADSQAGVSVFNVTNGTSPVAIAQVDTPGDARRVACSNLSTGGAAQSLVAVADGSGGLAIIDITDPPAAFILYQVSQFTLGGAATSITVAGDILYIGTNSGWLVAVDLLSGSILDRLALNKAIQDLVIERDTLYVTTSNILYAIPLYQGNLIATGSVSLNKPPRRLFAGGKIAYVTHDEGYDTYDLTNPNAPALISAGQTGQFGWQQIVANGSGLGVAVMSIGPLDPERDIHLYDISDPTQTNQYITTFDTPGSAQAASIYNGLAYVVAGEDGLQVINYLSYDTQGIIPTISLDASFPLNPATAEEGQRLRLSANVTDDVQVRNVEFYLDGVLAGTDGAFPFEYHFISPRLTQLNAFTVQARAADTGGNVAWSQLYTVTLTADTIPPLITHLSPGNGDLVGNTGTVAAFFNEPIDAATLISNTFTLIEAGPDGIFDSGDEIPVTTGQVQFRDDVLGAFMNFSGGLAAGYYRAEITTGLTDLTGNNLTAGQIWSFRVFDVAADSDGDCLPDALEPALNLDPNNPDTDGDTISDGEEDFDIDGLSNCAEVILGTDPANPDTDGDGILDGDEDSDLDGLTDREEITIYATDPFNHDTDGDSYLDGNEVAAGSDPLDPTSTPFTGDLPGESFTPFISVINVGNPDRENLPGETFSPLISIINLGNPPPVP